MKALHLFFYLALSVFVLSCSEDLDEYQNDDPLASLQKEIFAQSDLYDADSFDAYKNLMGEEAERFRSIPTTVFAAIADHFPDVQIIEIKSYQSIPDEPYKHYSVFMNNKTEAVVFQWGHLLAQASIEIVLNDNELTAGELSFKSLLRLHLSFDQIKIEEIIKVEENVFEIDFKNGDRIGLDEKGKELSKGKDSNGDDDDDGDHINPSTLPQVILDYINSNYPNNPIVEAERYANRYEVELDNGIKLEFDLNGNFLEISGSGGNNGGDDDSGEGESEDIDVSALSQTILDYISAQYPDATIIKAESDPNGFEVTLSNGLKLEFDTNGNFIEISGHSDDDNDDDDDNSQNINPNALPQIVLDYISTNYSDATILRAELDSDGYDVILSNGLKLEFNADGQFREISGGSNNDNDDNDGDSENGNKIDVAALPDTIIRFVARVCPTENIIRAEINAGFEEYYEVTLSNGLKIEFDDNGIFLDISGGGDCDEVSTSSLPQSILSYISNEFSSNIDKVKACDYGYRIDLNDDTRIFMKTDGTVIAVVLDA